MIEPRMPSQVASSLLSSRLVTGEELILSARMVGDLSDYDVWYRRRAYWIEETSDLIMRLYGELGPLKGFRDAVRAPGLPGGWRQDLPVQIGQTRVALGHVRSLFDELQSEVDREGSG